MSQKTGDNQENFAMTHTSGLTHLDAAGDAHMVNVGAKAVSSRVAIAQSVVLLAPATLAMITGKTLPKGDALACARVGAILAAKKTSDLIPLCHPLPLTYVDVTFEISEDPPRIRIIAESRCEGRTGVEMEALVAAQNAAAIIYDMCKAAQRDIVITDTRLLYKNGGRSGEYIASGYTP